MKIVLSFKIKCNVEYIIDVIILLLICRKDYICLYKVMILKKMHPIYEHYVYMLDISHTIAIFWDTQQASVTIAITLCPS